MFSLVGVSVSHSCAKDKTRAGAIFFCTAPKVEVLVVFFPGQSQILCPSFSHLNHVLVPNKYFSACLLPHLSRSVQKFWLPKILTFRSDFYGVPISTSSKSKLQNFRVKIREENSRKVIIEIEIGNLHALILTFKF